VTLTATGLLDREKLQSWVDSLLWEREVVPEDVLRMKGLLNLKGSNHMHMLQAVYELYEIMEGPAWEPQQPRMSKIVVIGRFLDDQRLQNALDQCVVDV
jgi:G3E family GTPase